MWGTTYYEYDDLDRRVCQIEPDGLTRYYEYDAAGNRTALALVVEDAPYGDDANTAGLWHLDDTSGDVVDSSSNGNDGTNYGATRGATGKFGNCFDFDGTNDYVAFPDSASLDITGDITVEAWINPDRTDRRQNIVAKWSGTNATRAYRLEQNEDTIRAMLRTTTTYDLVSAGTISSGVWTHVAMVRNGDELSIWINGVKDDNTMSVTGSINNSSKPVRLASSDETTKRWYDGKIDEVRISNCARTSFDLGGEFRCEYAYDQLNRMTKAVSPDNKTTYYEYDAASREIERIMGNGSLVYHNYDDAARLTSLLNVKSDRSAIATFYYLYDQNSNITRVDRDGGIVIYYEYDPLLRLTREKWQDGTPQVIYSYRYDYDPSGNRRKMVKDGTETYYNYNAANELDWEEVAGVYTYYTYDDDGNTLTKRTPSTGDTTYYEWTQANMMMSAAVPGKTVNYYAYDGALMRRSKIDGDGTTYYTWDGLNPILERAGDGTVQAQYTHGASPIPGIGSWLVANRSGAYQFPHMNQIGSVFHLTNADETVTQYYEYDAFGNELEETGSQTNLVRYSSHLLDTDTQLIYNFARTYKPDAGRFVSKDPMMQYINRYLYVRNSPNNRVDRRGLQLVGMGGDFDNNYDVVNLAVSGYTGVWPPLEPSTTPSGQPFILQDRAGFTWDVINYIFRDTILSYVDSFLSKRVNNDDPGKPYARDLIFHYLTGQGRPFVRQGGDWGKFIMNADEVRDKLYWEFQSYAGKVCARGVDDGDVRMVVRDVKLRKSKAMQLTLHGCHRIEVEGHYSAQNRNTECCEVTFHDLRFKWIDRGDLHPGVSTPTNIGFEPDFKFMLGEMVIFTAQESLVGGHSVGPYDIEIGWEVSESVWKMDRKENKMRTSMWPNRPSESGSAGDRRW